MEQGTLREALAKLAHEIWARWMTYQFGKCESGPLSHELIIPGALVDRWRRQKNTPYDELPESEKESDRKIADEILAVLHQGRTCVRCGEREGDPVILCGECRTEYALAAREKRERDINSG